MADAAKKSVDGWVQRLDDVLHDKNYWFVAQLDMLEEKTKVKRLYFALGKEPYKRRIAQVARQYMQPQSVASVYRGPILKRVTQVSASVHGVEWVVT